MRSKEERFLAATLARAIPAGEVDPLQWAVEHLRLPGSARSERFDPSITPWLQEPLRRIGDGVTRILTFMKPVQAGGSVLGEAALCYWIATSTGGDIQYNWEDDVKAGERWDKRIQRILLATEPVKALWPQDRFKAKRGLVMFPHCSLTVQGVWQPDNLDSDAVRFQINEEIHNWEPGRLEKAYHRTTAFWNSVIINISNAGKTGDQLDQAYQAGTRQMWEVRCPGCHKYHQMRSRWDEKRPELGGLRYDAEGCRLPGGDYDYNCLAGTIRYQMPCGYEVRDTPRERRALSLGGRYSAPSNPGAHLITRSYTLEACAVDYISWLGLIQEKHRALRALRAGDPEPWRRYKAERECVPWDPEDRPILGRIVLSSRLKDRAGLPDRHARFAALDRQQGEISKGELPHWWGLIRDVDARGHSLLVWEGKLPTDEEAVGVLERHEVMPRHVVVDSGHDTTHVYQFCLRHGFNAIKGGDEALFHHADGARRIFSPEKPLHLMLSLPATRPDPLDEPQFWFYSKSGIRERLAWLRGADDIRWEVPADVSEDYKAHMEAEERREFRHSRTNEIMHSWVQVSRRNDLFVCECYIAMLMEMAGLIGADLVQPAPG